MEYKLKEWLANFRADRRASGLACIEGIEEAVLVSEMYKDEDYYAKADNPVIFLWGASYRQPQEVLRSIVDIVKEEARFRGIDGRVRRALTVGINGGSRRSLLEAFKAVSTLKYGTSNKGLDGIAYRLLRWRLGDMRAMTAAEGIRRNLIQHSKLTSSHFDFLPELKKRIPFELWLNGLEI